MRLAGDNQRADGAAPSSRAAVVNAFRPTLRTGDRRLVLAAAVASNEFFNTVVGHRTAMLDTLME
jgi:hypothetical protein